MKKENKKKKILMIWTGNVHDTVGGVGQYRIVSPGNKLKELGYDVDIIGGMDIESKFGKSIMEAYTKMLGRYHLIIMKHTDNVDAISALFAWKKKYKCKIIWDFDDDLFSVRESQKIAHAEYGGKSVKKDIITTAMSFCDGIIVSTQPLKEKIENILTVNFGVSVPVFICPNFINPEEWPEIKYRPSNSPVIGYYGSTTHSDDLEMVKPSLYKILEKYPTANIKFLGMATVAETQEMLKDIPDKEWLKRIHLNGGTRGWSGFPELVLRQNWDIAIAPLITDQFNSCKSHIKWMECSMKSIPVVASNVYPYSKSVNGTKTIENGVTGFLCNDNEWVDSLSKLIEDPELRVKIGEKARKTVLANWNADRQIKHWENVIDTILA